MEILNFELSPAGSYEVATFDLFLGPKIGHVVNNLQLCKAKTGHYYFKSSAKKKGVKADGTDNWKPHFARHDVLGKEFNNAVMELLKPFVENLGQAVNPGDSFF